MKNIYKLISAILAVVLLLCSCSTAVETPTPETTPTETLTKEPISVPTHIKSVKDIGQIVYFKAEDDFSYTIDNFKFSKYRDEKNGIITINETLGPRVVEEDVPKRITWNFWGNNFELEYLYSSIYSINFYDFSDDVYVDCYDCVDFSIGEVFFLHGTNQPIHIWADIDNFPSNLETYEDCLREIYSVFENYIDLESYDVRCKTTYKNQSGASESVDGFHKAKPGEDVLYSFKFELTINGIKTDDYIYVGLSPNIIRFNCKASKYDSEKISEINQREIDYACLLTNKFINKYNPYETIRESAHFSGVDVLNDKLYLVINVTVPWYGVDENRDYDMRFYVDYERLQWKMALEGKS